MIKIKLKIKRKKFSKKEKLAIQKQIDNLHNKIRSELEGRTLPDPAEVIRQGREERDQQIWESLQGNRSK